MKIINQTESDLSIKDGSVSGVIMGVVFFLIGIGVGYSSLHSSVSSNYATLIFAAIFSIAGLASIFLSTTICIDFSKTNGQITYQKKRLIGSKTMNYNITDITRIETRKEWRIENNSSSSRGFSSSRQVPVSQSVIVFKDGTELPLDHQRSSSSVFSGSLGAGSVLMSGTGTEVVLANKVATFLGVPFQEIAPQNVGINSGIGGGIQL